MAKPKRRAVDRWRAIAWYDAVALQAQCSALELERRFSPDTVKIGASGRMQASGIFAKFRDGVMSPKIVAGGVREVKASLLYRVEQEFPGTARWFLHPIWSLVRQDIERTVDLHNLLMLFDRPIVRELFSGPGTYMRRRYRDADREAEALLSLGTFEALTALVGLMYEAAILTGDLERFHALKGKARHFTAVALRTAELSRVAPMLGRSVEKIVGEMTVYRCSRPEAREKLLPFEVEF